MSDPVQEPQSPVVAKKLNPKNAKVIALVSILVVVVAAVVVMSVVLATRRGSQSFSKGFTTEVSGRDCTITAYSGEDTNVKIPASINGKKVSAIAKGAFAQSKSIENIEFSDSISKLDIGEGAFEGLTKLQYVKLPDASVTIGNNAFKGCTQMTHIVLPSGLTSIGEGAFANCTNLKYTGSGTDENDKGFVLPANLTSIGKEAFLKCTALLNVQVNDNLTSIGEGAFESSGLKTFAMSASSKLTVLGDRAFYGANIASEQETPFDFVNITSIGNEAFAACRSNFTHIVLPKTIKAIGDEAFAGARSLRSVKFASDSEAILGKGIFQGCTQLRETTLSESLKELPERMFAGCYYLLYDNDFQIGKNIEKIGDGALSLFYGQTTSSRTSYLNKRVTVHAENERFVVFELAECWYSSNDGQSETKRTQTVLMSADKKELIAYFGAFDENCYYKTPDGRKSQIFKLTEGSEKFWEEIETIRGYAFAGVRAANIYVPPHVNRIGDYAFAGADIDTVYFEGGNCTLSDETFSDMGEDLIVCVRGGADGTIKEYVLRKGIAFQGHTIS